jgi:hypothetical protein
MNYHTLAPIAALILMASGIQGENTPAPLTTPTGKKQINHRFAIADIRKNKAMVISKNNEIAWEHQVKRPCDIQVMKNGNFLIAGLGTVVEVTPDGKTVWEYTPGKEVFSAVPLDNGNYLVNDPEEFRIIELNKEKKIVRSISTATENKNAHSHSRHIRKFSDGSYWVTLCGENRVNVYNGKGKLARSISVDKLAEQYGLKGTKNQQTYSIEELPNGHVLISAGFPAFVVEVDPKDRLVWGLSAKDVPESVHFVFSGGAKRLPNGNTVICNWTGHGNPATYVPVFEVNRNKKIVWTFKNTELVKKPLGIDLFIKP